MRQTPQTPKRASRDINNSFAKQKYPKTCHISVSSKTLPKCEQSKPTIRKGVTKRGKNRKGDAKMLMDTVRKTNQLNRSLLLDLKENENFVDYEYSKIDVSYRQYCVLGQKWIPILTHTQRNRILNPIQVPSKLKISRNLSYSFQVQNQMIQTSMQQATQISHIIDNIQTQKESIASFQSEAKLSQARIKERTIKNQQKQLQHVGTYQYRQVDIEDKQLIRQSGNQYQKQKMRKDDRFPIKNSESNSHFIENKDFENQIALLDRTVSMIHQRQFKQLGLYEQENCFQKFNLLDTSVESVLKYFNQLTETLYCLQFIKTKVVSNLRVAWGWAKRQKLNRIQNGKFLGSSNQVLPDELFELLQERQSKGCYYTFLHNRSIFDLINSHLNKFKPFFDSSGETFPWTFKLSSPLTFFEINNDSLPIVFQQIRVKILENCGMLCGLIVDVVDKPGIMMLQRRRLEREDDMVRRQLENEEWKEKEVCLIENEGTIVSIQIGDLVLEMLIEQIHSMVFI